MPTTSSSARTFSAPLGHVMRGSLVFSRGVSNVTVRVDPTLPVLFEARFEGEIPEVTVEDGLVEIAYDRGSLRDLLPSLFGGAPREGARGEVVLNPAVPWRLESRGGVNRLDAHLRGLRLEEVRIGGGVNHLDVDLPAPSGPVSITLGGGTNRVTLRRPMGTAARLEIGGGAKRVDLDGQHLRSAGGGASLASRDAAGARDRYDIRIGGGANRVSIAEAAETESAPPPGSSIIWV